MGSTLDGGAAGAENVMLLFTGNAAPSVPGKTQHGHAAGRICTGGGGGQGEQES